MSRYSVKNIYLILSIVVIILSMGLSSCGFRPVYSKNKISVGNELSKTEIKSAGGRESQLLSIDIEDIFYRDNISDDKLYSLNVSIKISELGIFIEPDGKTLRYRLLITSPYRLAEKSTGKILQNSTIEHIVSYNVSDEDYATFVARENAIRQAIKEIAQEYSQRISVYFATNRNK